LINKVTKAVAKAAMDYGMARGRIENWDEYKYELKARMLKTNY